MAHDLQATDVEYVDRHRTMSLATTDGRGAVNNATVYFTREDSGALVFGAQAGTTKARHIEANPAIGITMDDGGATAVGVQIRGRAVEIVDTEERDRVRALLQKRHPAAAAFYDQDSVRFFRVQAVERFLINFAWGVDWRQKVK